MMLFAEILKTAQTPVGWTVFRCWSVDMNQYITVMFDQQTGSLYGTHIIVRIDTADITVFTFDGNDGNMIGGQLF